ncbi:MAG: peptide chain release factor N(5)-glutamine methyltransferase [Ruminococcus sp.]|nr:peptide chain release factor N(5)-glutamine methyltransferase [Ruminococcus sp.]
MKNLWLEKLEDSNIESAEFEINEMLGKALGIDCRKPVYLEKLKSGVNIEVKKIFEKLCERRLNGEPLQYILGEWEFYGLPFKVGEGVLIPRQDTETLVDIAVKKLGKEENLIVTDLCSGSGCIGISLEKNLSCEKVVCVEKSDKALKYLKQNVQINQSKAEIINGDIFDSNVLSTVPISDLIVCNPPYITADEMKKLQREVTFEPESALFGGEDGLDYYRDITRIYKDKIKDGGMLLFEIGINQEDEVMRILIQHGFKNVRTRPDLIGVNRCVFGQKLEKTKLCTDVMSV